MIKRITPIEFAKKLDGRQYRQELTTEEEQLAKDEGLIVVYGRWDDNCILSGAIDDEISCYDWGTICIENWYILSNKCSDEYCPYWIGKKEDCKHSIEISIWEDGREYKTDIPHETFDIHKSDDSLYCTGIVFRLQDVLDHE